MTAGPGERAAIERLHKALGECPDIDSFRVVDAAAAIQFGEPDLVSQMQAYAKLILAAEALAMAASETVDRLRTALAEVMLETGAVTIGIPTHVMSAYEAPRKAFVTDEKLVPPEFIVQPPPHPDMKEIAKRLRAGERIQGTELANAGKATLRFAARTST